MRSHSPLKQKRESPLEKKLDDGNETVAASRRVEWSKNPNENDDLFKNKDLSESFCRNSFSHLDIWL